MPGGGLIGFVGAHHKYRTYYQHFVTLLLSTLLSLSGFAKF